MSSMGLGAWLSRYVRDPLPDKFIALQLLIALLGGLIAPILFFAFAIIDNYTPFLWLLTVMLGSLLGVEIPVIIRILKQHFTLKLNVSNVFTADYIGALIAALLFPLVLVPQLGLIQTGFVFGLLNTVVAAMTLYVFRAELQRLVVLGGAVIVVGLVLVIGFLNANAFTTQMENRLYQDEVIHAQSTPFQRLILTRRGERFRFYINGALQFDSYDEYRYHESLVHPAMSAAGSVESVLLLGGGDGLAARELLKYPEVQQITLVDLDPAVTQLFSNNPVLTDLNDGALTHPKLNIVHADAWQYLQESDQLYDVIIMDLPDPNNPSLSRLYSQTFYLLVQQHLSATGVMVTQATSPLYAREAFWCINETIASVDSYSWRTLPYHVYVPSFGEWGFIMASKLRLSTIKWSEKLGEKNVMFSYEKRAGQSLRYLNASIAKSMFEFPSDMAKVAVKINSLSRHPLMQYYQKGWEHWF